jgi:hypothetical protein
MCNSDTVQWRNASNTANIGLSQAGIASTATGNTADVLLYGTNSTGGIQAQRFMDLSTAPAQTGVLSCGNNVACVTQRNAAGNADITAVQVNGSNITALGGSAGTLFAGPATNTSDFQGSFFQPNTTNPSLTGAFRCSNNQLCIFSRNAANSADEELMSLGGNNVISIGNAMSTTPGVSTTNSVALPRLTITGGVNNGAGMQTAAGVSCSTAASANAACSTTITWAAAFPDTNYIVICQSLSSVSGGLVTPTFAANTSTTTSVVQFQNIGANAAASSANYGCLAVHL